MKKFPEIFENWFKEITFGDTNNISSYIKMDKEENLETNEFRFRFYTDNYEYIIKVVDKYENSNKISYLGCVMNCRKSRPGEDWLRGNDLPDGALNNETWNRIKNAIIRNELVKLESK